MPIERIQGGFSAQFKRSVGVDEEGNPILVSKTLGNIKPGTPDEDVWEVITALSGLQEGDLNEVFLKEDYQLVQGL